MSLFSRNDQKDRTPLTDKQFKAKKKARRLAEKSRKANRS